MHVEQIIDAIIALRCLGVSLRKKSCMLGDNASLFDSRMATYSRNRKRHVASSFYRVRETIAADIVSYYLSQGSLNPVNMLSKHWSRDNY